MNSHAKNDIPRPKGFLESAKVFISGLLVGAAEIVPGISGGTIAFIIGIYEDLLHSISTLNFQAFSELIRFRFSRFFNKISWKFLLCFLLGDIIALVSLAKVFTHLLNHEVWRMWLYSGFVGLVIGSCIYCYKVLKRIRAKDILSFAAGCIIAFFLSGANAKSIDHEKLFNVPIDTSAFSDDLLKEIREKVCINYSEEKSELKNVPASTVFAMIAKGHISPDTKVYDIQAGKTIPSRDAYKAHFYVIDIWVVLCGIIGVTAMLLPGISGSYLLNVLGMYGVVLGALVDWTQGLRHLVFEWDSFRIVFSMGLGIAIGAILFARVVSWLLDTYHQVTISCLIGFMVGALRAVWPFWDYAYVVDPLRINEGPKLILETPIMPQVFSYEFCISIFAIAFGIALVLLIENIAHRKRKKA